MTSHDSSSTSAGGALLLIGLAVGVLPTAARAYFLWPLPGSQTLESVRWAYHLSRVLPILQVVGLLLAIWGAVGLWRRPPSRWKVGLLALVTVLSVALLVGCHRYSAPQVFSEIQSKSFASGPTEEVPETAVVLGFSHGGQAKAYPLNMLAYHHRLLDDVGGQEIWVTYCTMCRTGKIFAPEVDGRRLDFDLVGAIRYNSVYEDRQTGTWWYQANGRAAVGELEGQTLTELRTDQMTLAQWLELHPDSQVLQPDPQTGERYKSFDMHLFDQRESKDENSMGWQWVVGVRHDDVARAYPWSVLRRDRILTDTLGDLPVAVVLDPDEQSARVWIRRVDDRELDLSWDAENEVLVDGASGSTFGFSGRGQGGELDGRELQSLPFVIEFWHSFEYFSGGELWSPPQQDSAEGSPQDSAAG